MNIKDLDLKKYISNLTPYTELRVQENRSVRMTFLNGNMVANNKDSNNGVSARVYKGGSWGFASSSVIDDQHILEVIESAKQNALFLDSRRELNKPNFKKTIGNLEKDLRTKKKRFTQTDIKSYLLDIDTYISKKYSDLSNRIVSLRYMTMEKSLITSDEATFYSYIPDTHLFVSLTITKDGVPTELLDTFGGLGDLEEHLNQPEQLYNKIDELYQQLIDKSNGVHAAVGLKEVILDASIGGILAHEAIGHTTEADLVLGGSIAGDYLDQEVASPLITLVDFAHTFNGELCPVPIFMDDEGVMGEDVTIIDKGILKSYMHNKDTARLFESVAKGNGRAYEYSDEPLIRMRNTAILPGSSKLEDMIASIEDGYYLTKTGNGQADTTSEFTFSINMGYEIKNGKIGRAIKDTTISGIAFDVLKTVSMVSDDMYWDYGMCGKKTAIPVGMGGPAIKCKVNIGGK